MKQNLLGDRGTNENIPVHWCKLLHTESLYSRETCAFTEWLV